MASSRDPKTTYAVRRLTSIPGLDGLRGIAVLLVIMSHTPLVIGFTGSEFVDRFLDGGYLGVDIFFVLSGFLITALLLSEQGQHGSVRFGSFYGRRALRLLPALFLVLATYAFYNLLAGEPQGQLGNTARYAAVYISNWQTIWKPGTLASGWGHLWSLSVEEQFYLIWPWILIGLLGIRHKAWIVTTVLVIAIVAIAIHRAVMWESISSELSALAGITANTRLFQGTDTRADSLLIGALLASLWVRRRTPTKGVVPAAWIGTAVLIVCIAFTNGGDGFIYLGGFDLIAVAAAALILAAVDGRWIGNRLLSTEPLRLVGRVSYGLYLWHLPIFYIVTTQLRDLPVVGRLAVAYGLTVVFTAASWLLVEQPALRLKRHLERKQDVSVARAGDEANPVPPRWKPAYSAIVGVVILVAATGMVTGIMDLTTSEATASRDEYHWKGARSFVFDDFHRPDQTGLGTTATGQEWRVLSGDWAIADDHATLSSPGFAVVPVEAAHVRAIGGGLAFRCVDAENCWRIEPLPAFGTWSITKIVKGRATSFGNTGLSGTSAKTSVAVHDDGDHIDIAIDGVILKTIEDDDLAGSGGIGLGASSDGNLPSWREFQASR